MGRTGEGSIPFKAILLWIVALVLGSTGVRITADEPNSKRQDPRKVQENAMSKAALKAAGPYLALLDKEKYAESWQASAVSLRRSLTQRKWVDALKESRKPFGELESRKLDRVEMVAVEYPGRIDQAWIYNNVQFTSGETCCELAIVYLENGTRWKVSGYFIGNPDEFPKPKAADRGPMSSRE
jgi:hypothetical protein